MKPYTPQPGDVTVTVFNATGGSNRTRAPAFANWYDDLGPNDTRPDAAIVCEADGFHDVLSHLGRLTVGHAPAGVAGHGVREVAVVTGRKPLRAVFVKLTDFIHRPGPKKLLWHDRHAVKAVVQLLLLRLVLVSSHAPAVIQGKDGRLYDNPGAREWAADGEPRLRAVLASAMSANRALVHGWDANQRPANTPVNPTQTYADLGMGWLNDGVMYLGWNPHRLQLVWEAVTATPPGSDGHKTITATFRPVPLRNRVRARLSRKES